MNVAVVSGRIAVVLVTASEAAGLEVVNAAGAASHVTDVVVARQPTAKCLSSRKWRMLAVSTEAQPALKTTITMNMPASIPLTINFFLLSSDILWPTDYGIYPAAFL